jgi:hypothetical protein
MLMVEPRWSTIALGVMVMLVGPAVMWGLLPRSVVFGFGGLILFATGWLLLGGGVRPGGRALWGVLTAAGLYVYVGLVWVFWFNLSLGAPPIGLLHPGILLLALGWPVQVAQALELFGMSFN